MKLSAHGWAILGLLIVGSGRADMITLTPNMDTMVVGGSFHAQTSSQHAYLNQSLVGNIGDIQSTIAPSQGILSFDLPSGLSQVSQATLNLFEHGNGGTASGVFAVYRNTSPWQKTTVTWDSRPSVDPTPVATLNISDGKDYVWRSWNVTAVVNGWLSGNFPNYGLTFAKEGTVYPVVFFGSSLLIEQPYTPPPPPSPGVGTPGSLPSGYEGPQLILDFSGLNSAPEPSSLALAGIAAIGMIGYRWRQRKPRN